MRIIYLMVVLYFLISFVGFSQNESSCDWGYSFTASNATIAIQQENFSNIEIGCGTYPEWEYISTLIANTSCPVWLGVFYTDDNGELKCGGCVEWDNTQSISIAAWGDDPTTPEKDGFSDSEPYIFKFCLNGEESYPISGNDVEMSTVGIFSDSYSTNGFGSVLSLFYETSYYCSDIIECNVDLEEDTEPKKILKTIDLLGRSVASDQSGFIIHIYSDNSFSKLYKF